MERREYFIVHTVSHVLQVPITITLSVTTTNSTMKPPKLLSTLLLLLLLIIPIIANKSSQNIKYDIYPFIRVYTNGTVQRFFGQGYAPPTTDPTTGVHSKDVKVSPTLNISARIFLPSKPDPRKRHAVLVYYHGGGFFSESAFSPSYHKHLNSLVAKSNVVAVSVNYRLAPEFPLPVAYQDSWLVMEWVFQHFFRGRGSDVWLKRYADFGRVYLGGDSAGANIVHNMAIRVGSMKLAPGIRIQGMFLNCPYFLGKKPVGNEASYPYLATLGKVWMYAYPKTSGLDDPLVNPGMDPNLRKLGVKRVLVYVAGLDVLRFRGWYYASVLKKSGWNGVVNVVEVKGEDHVFVLIKPTSPNSLALIDKLAFFLSH